MSAQDRYAFVVGVILREFRDRAKISQGDLAARVGATQPTLSRWERGETCPTLSEARRVAEALGVPLARIVSIAEVALQTDVSAMPERIALSALRLHAYQALHAADKDSPG